MRLRLATNNQATRRNEIIKSYLQLGSSSNRYAPRLPQQETKSSTKQLAPTLLKTGFAEKALPSDQTVAPLCGWMNRHAECCSWWAYFDWLMMRYTASACRSEDTLRFLNSLAYASHTARFSKFHPIAASLCRSLSSPLLVSLLWGKCRLVPTYDSDISATLMARLAQLFCHWQPGPVWLHRQGPFAVPPRGDGFIANSNSYCTRNILGRTERKSMC